MESKVVEWRLIRNGSEVLDTLRQDIDDLQTNGRGYVLNWLVPEEHADAAERGEWCEEGFTYHVGTDYYEIVCRVIDDEEEIAPPAEEEKNEKEAE